MLLHLTISGSETNSTVKMALLPLILASSTSTTGAASGYACVEWKRRERARECDHPMRNPWRLRYALWPSWLGYCRQSPCALASVNSRPLGGAAMGLRSRSNPSSSSSTVWFSSRKHCAAAACATLAKLRGHMVGGGCAVGREVCEVGSRLMGCVCRVHRSTSDCGRQGIAAAQPGYCSSTRRRQPPPRRGTTGQFHPLATHRPFLDASCCSSCQSAMKRLVFTMPCRIVSPSCTCQAKIAQDGDRHTSRAPVLHGAANW